MQTMLQLDPPIPVLTPLGEGLAVGWVDKGTDFQLEWIVMLDSREIWVFANPLVRAQHNFTYYRERHSLKDLFEVSRGYMPDWMYKKMLELDKLKDKW